MTWLPDELSDWMAWLTDWLTDGRPWWPSNWLTDCMNKWSRIIDRLSNLDRVILYPSSSKCNEFLLFFLWLHFTVVETNLCVSENNSTEMYNMYSVFFWFSGSQCYTIFHPPFIYFFLEFFISFLKNNYEDQFDKIKKIYVENEQLKPSTRLILRQYTNQFKFFLSLDLESFAKWSLWMVCVSNLHLLNHKN